jgi:hypothetical protein
VWDESDHAGLVRSAVVRSPRRATPRRLGVRRAQVEAQAALKEADERIEDIGRRQLRIRDNLAAVPAGSDLQRRWLNDLAESENEMRAAETRREAALETLRMADDEVRTAVRAL